MRKYTPLKAPYVPQYCQANIHQDTHAGPENPQEWKSTSPPHIPDPHDNKKLNEILTPYIPNDYALGSTQDFLKILKMAPATQNNIIASLDVESLFTNVPVDRTIQLLLDRIYRCEDTPPLEIPGVHLRELLKICMKEAPFICPRREMYCQIDGVAMGSPLGVLFANFFVGSIESTIIKSQRPIVYTRYIENIFVCIKDASDLLSLKEQLQNASGLNFI